MEFLLINILISCRQMAAGNVQLMQFRYSSRVILQGNLLCVRAIKFQNRSFPSYSVSCLFLHFELTKQINLNKSYCPAVMLNVVIRNV